MVCAWKDNWKESRQHFLHWWKRAGLVVGAWAPTVCRQQREDVPNPGPSSDLKQRYADPEWRAQSIHWTMARAYCPADVLPIANCDIGPGSLALLLGSEPSFSGRTVWFNETIGHVAEPENLPPLKFDPENHWWQVHSETLRRTAELAEGKYMVGCPDLIENIDILASLRGMQQMLIDLVERPEWAEQKLAEITDAWIEAYDRVYDIIHLEDDSSAFWAFSVWGPGRTAKLQCDASAMISPAMFERFVVPTLRRQCRFLDHSIFHLDGHQCIPHLDLLLDIPELDAIEWTPDPQVPPGGDPHWYDLYRRILNAGKCVQVLQVEHDQIQPLLDAIGPDGVYIMTTFADEADGEKLERLIEPYR